MKLSIIIPAYNESDTIESVIHTIQSIYHDAEIIVIDDASSDKTADIAQNAGATVLRHPYNIGNGAAIKTGIRNASGDVIIFMDADGQHLPQDIEKLLERIPEYDMVVGARKNQLQNSWIRSLGNTLYNALATYVTGFPVQDLTSGFRAIKSDIVRNYLYLLPNTYSYPTTLTLSILKSGRRLAYVPIYPNQRTSGKSQINIIKDGIRFLMIILKICTLYSPLRIFLPISTVIFGTGLFWYGYTWFFQGRFTNMSALLFSTSVIVFLMGLISEQICQMRFEKSE
ncbi:MAG: glycosyltransferase family 2 protein [Candidatus Magnetomorum sp.]|nr:glycosyltransferase family 2 protein [Candidatus Magnetomorum sp.]